MRELDRERRTVRLMIGLYCRGNHRTGAGLCGECRALLAYAEQRLDACPFKGAKPACSACAVHCYAPEKQRAIQAVMRYSGPRMLYHHPILVFAHALRNLPRKEPRPSQGAFMKLNADFCESRCPVCTRARQGHRLARLLQRFEMLLTRGGCPAGRDRLRKFGVRPNETRRLPE